MAFNIFGYNIEVRKEVAAVVITVLVFLAGLGGYLIVKGNNDIIIDSANEQLTDKKSDIDKTEAPENANKSADVATEPVMGKKEEIKIYVVGCVSNPGVVTLEKGQLIEDAVMQAGGFTKDADPFSVNLVYRLEENLMLYIKSRDEIKKELQEPAGASISGVGAALEKGSAGAVVNRQENEVIPAGTSGGKVNINTASAGELTTLSGIGEAKAKDIIAYREMNGLYKRIEDIMKVQGIKENSFNKIKDSITVK